MAERLHEIIQSYKHTEEGQICKPAKKEENVKNESHVKLSSRPKKPSLRSEESGRKRLKVEPKEYSDLADLAPSIQENLTVVFIGFNPGVQSSKTQHHYAHATNLFWRLFNASPICSTVLKYRGKLSEKAKELYKEIFDDSGMCHAKPIHDYQLVEFGIGFTDLVLRCTKQAQELSSQEKLDGVPRLFSEFRQSQAPFLVFIGKGIWETFCRYMGHNVAGFQWGLQTGTSARKFHSYCQYKPKVYVFPSTSGLVTSMKYDGKLKLWEALSRDVLNSVEKHNT